MVVGVKQLFREIICINQGVIFTYRMASHSRTFVNTMSKSKKCRISLLTNVKNLDFLLDFFYCS